MLRGYTPLANAPANLLLRIIHTIQNTYIEMRDGDDHIEVRRINGPTAIYGQEGEDVTRVLRNLVDRTNFIQGPLYINPGPAEGV